jgi:hypothetical protein
MSVFEWGQYLLGLRGKAQGLQGISTYQSKKHAWHPESNTQKHIGLPRRLRNISGLWQGKWKVNAISLLF